MRRTAKECRTQAELDELRIARRDEKRRKRARLYAKGLNCYGKPHTGHASAHRIHPSGCGCYDCLFPPVAYEPIVCAVSL